MSSEIILPKWYVLHTKSRFEKVVNEGLLKKSIEAFLPTMHVKSKRRDRKLMLDLPIFPGYTFVKSTLNAEENLSILKTAGVVKIIGNMSGPVPVESGIVESLQIMVASKGAIKTENKFKKGEKVVVLYGPFAGLTGIFQKYRGKGRVYVNITLLGQSASVEIEEEDIEHIVK